MQPIDTIKYRACTIEVHHDDAPSDPRENDNLGTISHWHRRYNLGEERIDREFNSIEEWMTEHKDDVVLPLGLLDHSGLHLWVGGGNHACDPGGWDSGTVGFVHCSLKKARENWCLKGDEGWDHKLTDHEGKELTMRQYAVSVMASEIKEYDAYLSGECYGYITRDEQGEEIDSCWGFIGDTDYMIEQAKASIDHRRDDINELLASMTGDNH